MPKSRSLSRYPGTGLNNRDDSASVATHTHPAGTATSPASAADPASQILGKLRGVILAVADLRERLSKERAYAAAIAEELRLTKLLVETMALTLASPTRHPTPE
jgi:hypothetical protein